MSNNIFNTIWLACSFLVLFGIAEFLYHKIKVKADYTRNLVHVGTGFLTFLFPVLLNNHWWVLLLCSSFAGLLLISLKLNLLKSINAIGRQSVGSLAFPVVVYSCYLVSEYLDHERAYFLSSYINPGCLRSFGSHLW